MAATLAPRQSSLAAPGQPLHFRAVRVIGLGPDSAVDLAKLDIQRPAAMRLVTARDGKLFDEPASP